MALQLRFLLVLSHCLHFPKGRHPFPTIFCRALHHRFLNRGGALIFINSKTVFRNLSKILTMSNGEKLNELWRPVQHSGRGLKGIGMPLGTGG